MRHIRGLALAQFLHQRLRGGGCGAQVFDAAIGARADKHFVHGNIHHGRARLQAHVLQGALHGGAFHGVFFVCGIRHLGIHGHHHLGRGAPSHLRFDVCGLQHHGGIKMRARVRVQGVPVSHRLIPIGSFGRHIAPLGVGNGFFVHGHQPCARARFNRHIADCHTAFHAQRFDGAASKFDGVARAACGADLADDGQHHIFGCHACAQLPIHADQHIFGLFRQQGLRRQHMFHLAGAYAVRQCAKSAVGAGVAVAADHGHARQSCAVFGADDMHDALVVRHKGVVSRCAKFFDVFIQRQNLLFADGVGYTFVAFFPAVGGRVVVGCGHDRLDAPGFALRLAQAFKSLWAGDFVHQMAVDIQHGGAVFFGVYGVFVPNFVVKRAGGGGWHGGVLSVFWRANF